MPPASTPADRPFGPRELVLYIVTIFIFGSGWLPLKLQLGVVAPEVSATWRFLAATLVMLAFVLVTRGRLLFHARDHLVFAGLGATLFSLNFLSFYYAGYHLPSGLMSVMFSLSAVLIPLFSAVLMGVPLRRRILMGAAAGVGGLGLVFGPSIADGQGIHGVWEGLGLAFAGTVCFALGTLLSGIAGRRGYPVSSMTFWGFFYGFALLLAISLARGQTFTVEWTPRYLGSLAVLVTFQTLTGFAVYMELVRRIGASRAGYATVIYPLVALALSTVFEGYHWTLVAACGIALVLAGNLLVLRAPPAPPPPVVPPPVGG